MEGFGKKRTQRVGQDRRALENLGYRDAGGDDDVQIFHERWCATHAREETDRRQENSIIEYLPITDNEELDERIFTWKESKQASRMIDTPERIIVQDGVIF